MAKILNERNTGFSLELCCFESENSDWVCYNIGIIVSGITIYSTRIQERRTIEIDEMEQFIKQLQRYVSDNEDYQFCPVEPEFLFEMLNEGIGNFNLKFSVDVGREFEGIRTYNGDDLSIEITVSNEEIIDFIEELNSELHSLIS